jgi:hypothetical protein
MNRLALIAAALSLLAVAPSRATAGSLTLNYSGSFSADTTLGGTPLGAETPFTFAATFDSTADQDPTLGHGLFPATVVFDITGFGTFTTAPGAGEQVELGDPRIAGGGPQYLVGLSQFDGVQFRFFFDTASPPFDADNPSPSVLSDFVSNSNFLFGGTIPLAGGAGELVIPSNGITSFGPTATITSAAVPEPSSFTLLGVAVIGSAGLAAARRRARHGARHQGDSL